MYSMIQRYRTAVAVLLVAITTVSNASAKPPPPPPVQALFGFAPLSAPQPTDFQTVIDLTQNTFRRVNLPLPSCPDPSACFGTQTLNTLDGFNTQPYISIPFSGPIDPATVNSDDVFFVNLGSTIPSPTHGDKRIGINQVIWNTLNNTLHAESDELLDQHTVYALIVTNGIHDTHGNPVLASNAFKTFPLDLASGKIKDPGQKAYDLELSLALVGALVETHTNPSNVVVASVFTTQSVTSTLEKIRDQIHRSHPAPADFNIEPGGTRAVFNAGDITGLTWNLQYQVEPVALFPVDRPIVGAISGEVGPVVAQVAFGRFASPNYLTPEVSIPPTGTLTGSPKVQGTNEMYFDLVIPSGPKPAHGWPVAIFGHGFGSSRDIELEHVMAVASEHGLATVLIDAVGQGFGPQSTVDVSLSDGSTVTLPAPGRTIDQNGDNFIDGSNAEGFFSSGPLVAFQRDSVQQTVADLMQLVKEIQVGMDVDGDGHPDLDASRIYYFGQSFGGIYGTIFTAVEPAVKAGVPNVPGGPYIDIVRLGLDNSFFTFLLGIQIPSLLNGPGGSYIDNIPLRNEPPVIDNVPGAEAIQQLVDGAQWIEAAGECVPWAQHLRAQPLPGVPAKPVIIQFAKGDETVANPTTTALIRAGKLTDRTSYFRNDLLFAAFPDEARTNPHTFLTDFDSDATIQIDIDAQEQIGAFFESNGTNTINPDPTYFEVPIAGPLPEDLNFLP